MRVCRRGAARHEADRFSRSRWPAIGNLRLIGITFAFTFVLDFVMEACMLLPLGLYTYPGAIQSVSFNAGHYYQWPGYEGVMWGAVQAGLACLRFFTDDRRRTIVERGIDQVRGGYQRLADAAESGQPLWELWDAIHHQSRTALTMELYRWQPTVRPSVPKSRSRRKDSGNSSARSSPEPCATETRARGAR